MRIIKPQHLSVLHRPFEKQNRAYLGVAVLAYLPLAAEPALLPEQELWAEVAPLMDPQIPLDAVMPKSGAEYLMIGDACAPGGQEVGGLEVSVRVGALAKKLRVHGERYWLDDERLSDPRPFKRWPLSWAQTWGGPTVAENPLGRGTAPEQTAAGELLAFPPVQHPDHPCLSPKKAAMPASFAPLSPLWPQRRRFDGTYDDAWMKGQFPGPPSDFDWRFHCIASADQWQPQSFDGTETVEIAHMHPDHPRLEFKLPGIRPVVIARLRQGGGFKDRQGEPRLSTIWLLPNQLRAVLVWHAMFEIADEFADQVELMCIAAEWLDRPKGAAHYVQAIAARLDPEHGAEKILDDFELLPEGLATPNETMEHFRRSLGGTGVDVAQVSEQLAESERRVDKELAKALGDEAASRARQAAEAAKSRLGIPRPPTQLPPDPTGMIATSRSLAASQPRPEDLRSVVAAQQAAVRDEIQREMSGSGASQAELSRLLNPTPPTSPISRSQMLGEFDSMLAQARRTPDIEVPRIDQKLRDMASRADALQSSMTRGVAHMQPPPPPLANEAIARWRDGAARARQAGQSFSRLKLKSGDFSGMDLSGVDFSEAELEGVDFSGAKLVGADFTNAGLAHAKFDQAVLDGARLMGANIGKASFVGASCVGTRFSEAIVQYTVMSRGNFARADFKGVTLLEVDATESLWNGADLTQATFIKAKLAGSGFGEATMLRTTLLECEIGGADFSRGKLTSADFITCMLDGAKFDDCDAANARFVYRSSLAGASFKGARAPGANFRGTPLGEADFSAAVLDGSDFSEAACTKANFEGASLKNALLMKTDFTGARLARANLMQAIAEHAVFHGADLRDTNLYASDLARVDADTETRLDGAFTAKARTLPRRKVEPPGSSRRDG